jgi:succinyl-CoA synthetase alpha subunit
VSGEVTVQTHVSVRQDSYCDSVLLMRFSLDLESREGIAGAVVVMGTPHNKELLIEMGYPEAELAGAGPNDLIVAARAAQLDRNRFERAVDALLHEVRSVQAGGVVGPSVEAPRGLVGALAVEPEANLALISVPGQYAAREARRALALGLHVMLFSDNVSVADEVALKAEAARRGLLCMGPDCGTAIIGGKPLAFANVVRPGSIGIVGASGTGIQEISCCIHRLGGGISQAIGTGGRDLSDEVGGIMTLLGVRALAADPRTEVLVVVSKPPSASVARKVVDELGRAGKPAVVHFVGEAHESRDEKKLGRGTEGVEQVVFADTLAGTAEEACRWAGMRVPVTADAGATSATTWASPATATMLDPDEVARLVNTLAPTTRLCGLFCGGTTGQEAVSLLARAGVEVYSNLHKKGPLRVSGIEPVPGHCVLDLGDDVFTAGRPHPMIEPGLRNERLAAALEDPAVGLLLADVVLGHGSHADPAGVLAAGVVEARKRAMAGDRQIVAIASITGTDLDPQSYETQWRHLEDAGIVVMSDNRRAAQLTAAILTALPGKAK